MMSASAKLTYKLISCLWCEKGSVAIETAFVAPVLLALALGGFEASYAVARQTEMQSAAAEAAAIVRAAPPETATERATIRDIVRESTGLRQWQVFVAKVYRCGTSDDYVSSDSSCSSGDAVSEYVYLFMWDRYTPVWAAYGIGDPFYFTVSRTIQVG